MWSGDVMWGCCIVGWIVCVAGLQWLRRPEGPTLEDGLQTGLEERQSVLAVSW